MSHASHPNTVHDGTRFPRLFGERYVLLKELGQGGMGQVYMAVTGEAGAERVCALKIIRNLGQERDPAELAARFLDEAKVVTKLSHENLVFVFDHGVVRGQGYLAMEFVQGKTLTELWNRCALRGVGFPVAVSLYLATELCAGLGYAHREGDLRLVHRDVSPSNVVLSYTGGVKLIDFGLAKWKSKVAETQSGVNWGKVSYMSPEQYLGKPIDHRSDLFSAGLILWELLTGRQLFPSSEARARDPEIPAPSKMNPKLEPGLDQAVMRALAADPAARYQTGEQMSAALAAFLPREAGKLHLAEFLRSLFEADIKVEAAERAELCAGAAGARARAAGARARGEDPEGGDEAGDPLLGVVLAERYYVKRLVGEGAMGRVYEGHHTGIGKRVAIKIPRHGERRKSELLQRFRLEAQAASQIGHPNIADVTDCGSTPDGRFFFVMEFIDGVEVAKLVRRDGALPAERALLIAVQICRALEAAHKAGIIHRDLKPSNVMLVRDRDRGQGSDGDFVKVLDFGVAKFLRADVGRDEADLTDTDAAVGTPRYMAPEQIKNGQDIDFRVDIYAVGGILFFMLSGGHAPVEGDTVENVWRKKVLEDPTPLARWRSDLPPEVEALVMSCVARDPGRRPASMETLRRELGGAVERMRLAGSSVLAGKVPSSTAVLRDRRGWRRLAMVAALVLGIGGAAAAGVALLTAPPAPAPAEARPGLTTEAPARGAASREAPATPALPVPPPLVAPAPVAETHNPPAAAPPGTAAAQPAPSPASAALLAPPTPPSAPAPAAAPPGAAVAPSGDPPLAHPGRRPAPAVATGAVAEAEAVELLTRAEQAFQEGRHNEAIRLGRQALAVGGGIKAWLLLGKAYRTTWQYPEALEAYEQALALEPGNARALEGRRKAAEALGRPAR